MAAIGGSIESVSLDSRSFAVAADAEVERKLGGFENEILANGDGTARMTKTRALWSLSGITIEVDDFRGDAEFLQELANSPDFFPVAVTYASGAVYQGTGQLMEEMTSSSQSATADISLSGPGILSPQ